MDLNFKNNLIINSDNNDDTVPVSPIGQILCTSSLSVCVQAIFELEQPMDICGSKKAIQDILLPCNPRFCSLMTEDKNGVLVWKKTEVNVDDHVFVPEFPPGLNEYDEFVDEYICNIHLIPLPKSRPLWEFHFLNYNTSKARATLIINMHHSIGDGISLMSLVFSCITRADNPNLGLTFPSAKTLPRKRNNSYYSWASSEFVYHILRKVFTLVLVLWYTVSDFIISLRMEDSKLPIRGPPGVEMLPKVMSSVTFHIEDIRKIKSTVGGTVNDVLMGVIFYGFQRYLQINLSHGSNFDMIFRNFNTIFNVVPGSVKCYRVIIEKSQLSNSDSLSSIIADEHEIVSNGKKMANLRVTGILTMNTRAMHGLKNIEDMLKPNSEAQWGNRFGILHIPLPLGNVKSPLDFVRRAKQIIDRKKMSLEGFINTRLLGFLGREVSASRFYNMLSNTTLLISNMVGPMEKMAINQTPVKSFYFSMSGLPQTLLLTIVSYMGSVRIEVIGAKGYVDTDTLAKCFGECFDEIREAACTSEPFIDCHYGR